MDDGLARLLRRQDGIITTRQALRHLSEKALRHRVTSGRWRRVLAGIYTANSGPPTLPQTEWMAVLRSGGDRDGWVCLAGLSALCAAGLRGVEPAAIDVLVPYQRSRPLLGTVRVHRSRVLPRLAAARPGRAPPAPSTGPSWTPCSGPAAIAKRG